MLLSYSLISTLILAFGYLAYRLVMAGERQHTFNRCFILLIYAAAMVLPLIMLSVLMRPAHHAGGLSAIEIGQLTGGLLEGGETPVTRWLTAETLAKVIFWLYIAGVILVALYSVFSVLMLWSVVRRGERIECDGFTLILIDSHDISPFSLRHTVVMNRTDYEEAGDMILLHECAHLRFDHWLDVLIAQMVVCLQWYNPAAWVLREELKAIHEFQADEAVISSGVNLKQYQLLLIKKAVGSRFQSLANSLNHSKLKKRVTMMYKKKTSTRRRIAALLVLPALAAGCAVTAIPAVADVIRTFALSSAASIAVSDAPGAALASTPSSDDNNKTDRKEVYTAAEVLPEPPGGMSGLMQYLNQNVRYPEEAFLANEQGRVIVKFIVEADGSISDPRLVHGVSPSLDQEALRVVKTMPKWTPAKVNGKPVASWFNLPISFKLQDNTPKEDSGNTNQK
ncbi:MAG: M56 family metallopeptidase [Muribaculaceae bacterium]|nr:M56 family metallopeptidase [Muribaculaceae bacterium]